MKKTHSHSFFLILAILVMLVVASIYGYMYHAVGLSTDRAIKAASMVSSEKNNRYHELAITELYGSTSADWAKLPELFVPSNRVVTFIEAIESLGKQTGSDVSLTSIDADSLEGAAVGTQGVIRGHVDAHGSWSSVMRTLMYAEALPYLISIDHVNVNTSGSGDAQKQDRWSISFDIQAKELVLPAASSI